MKDDRSDGKFIGINANGKKDSCTVKANPQIDVYRAAANNGSVFLSITQISGKLAIYGPATVIQWVDVSPALPQRGCRSNLAVDAKFALPPVVQVPKGACFISEDPDNRLVRIAVN